MHEALRFLEQAVKYEETAARLFEYRRTMSYMPGKLTSGCKTDNAEGFFASEAEGDVMRACGAAIKLAFSYFYAAPNNGRYHMGRTPQGYL